MFKTFEQISTDVALEAAAAKKAKLEVVKSAAYDVINSHLRNLVKSGDESFVITLNMVNDPSLLEGLTPEEVGGVIGLVVADLATAGWTAEISGNDLKVVWPALVA